MTKDEALRLALEVLKRASDAGYSIECEEAITAIKAALEAKDEPVAWADMYVRDRDVGLSWTPGQFHTVPLYTTPPQRTWVGLTYEDMVALQKDLYNAKGESVLPTTFAMAVEAKLKEKNT